MKQLPNLNHIYSHLTKQMNETEMKEYLWDPSFTCNGTKIPFHISAIVTGFQLNYENIGKCSKAMEAKYKVSKVIRRDVRKPFFLHSQSFQE